VKVTITGRHVEMTAGLRDFAEKHMAKLEDFFTGVKGAHVILSVEKYRHTAEIQFQAGDRHFNSKKTTKDMYASIEEAVHALLQQASKRKDKERGQHSKRHAGKPVSIKGMAAEEPAAKPVRGEAPVKKVMRVKAFAAKPMTLEEAVLELEGSKHPVLAYINADSQTVHVVFTRQDGSIGLVEEP
jgi:putative sigma-54 modulation protein